MDSIPKLKTYAEAVEKATTIGMKEELVEQLSKPRFRSSIGNVAANGPSRQKRAKVSSRPRSKSVVVPAAKTDHPAWLPLTNLDRVVNPTFVSIIFLYQSVLCEKNNEENFAEVTTNLKESLAKVLVDFYPLAGRLTFTESGIVDLQCNDAGAIFVEASVNFELSELAGAESMQMLSGMDVIESFARTGPGLLYVPDQVNNEIPVLVIQATRFLCGSIAVAVNWHHTVADGWSGCHFVRSWSAIATGQPLPFAPSFDRTLLQPRSPPDASRICNGNYGSGRKRKRTVETLVRHQPAEDLPRPVVKPFFFSKGTIQKLKEDLNGPLNGNTKVSSNSRGDQKPFTSTETISAELWKLLTKARLILDGGARSARSRFFMFVDGRKRLGLPQGYFGNVVCSACAESTQYKLVKRPFSYAASLIQKATRGIDQEYFRSLIDWVEERGLTTSSKECESGHLDNTGNDVAATFWTFFPLYEIDFGWGKPVLGLRNAPPRQLIDGFAMMPDPEGSGNMVGLLNLHKDRMDKLEQDPKFRETALNFSVAAHKS